MSFDEINPRLQLKDASQDFGKNNEAKAEFVNELMRKCNGVIH